MTTKSNSLSRNFIFFSRLLFQRHGDHSSHSKEEEEDANAFVWKMLVLLVAIYAFYLVESMFALVSRLFHGNSVDDDGSDGGHGHSHHFVPEAQSSSNQKAAKFPRHQAGRIIAVCAVAQSCCSVKPLTSD